MNHDLEKYIIRTEDTILNALEGMNKNGVGTVFICDMHDIFYGTITDGDVRRYLVNGGDIHENVMLIVNRSPYIVHNVKDKSVDYQKIMQEKIIKAIPVINNKRMLIDFISVMDNFRKIDPIEVPVVIMAGGMGTRLQPYTDILPKPLIPIGNMTIVERIMESFIKNGSSKFFMILNYKKEFIKTYFHDKKDRYDIDFVEERTYSGTAGGLALLKGKIKDTFIMTNCDILIDESYKQFVNHHKASENIITLVGAKKCMQLPYGIMNLDLDGNIISMEEKPKYEFVTNTGFYIIEPKFLDLVPPNTFIHMPDLIKTCIDKGYKAGAYQIEEDKWFDMGQLDELEKMKRRFA